MGIHDGPTLDVAAHAVGEAFQIPDFKLCLGRDIWGFMMAHNPNVCMPCRLAKIEW